MGSGAGLCAGMAAQVSRERVREQVGLAPIGPAAWGERDAWGEDAFCWEAYDLGFNAHIEHRWDKKAFKLLEDGQLFVCLHGPMTRVPNPTPFFELWVLVDFGSRI